MRRIRQHLTYANVISTLCLFLLLGGGSAVALSGTNTVFTDDIADDTRPASGGNPAGGLTAADLRANSVGTSEVTNESLTGQDIKNRSGIETCQGPLTAKYGPICVGTDGGSRTFNVALNYCADLGLRLPTLSEAVTLARKYDVPGVTGIEPFWTDETINDSPVVVVREDGIFFVRAHSTPSQTVCVTDPSA